MNNFNLVAPVYEWLKKLVFGQTLAKAEAHFTQLIGEHDRVLIVGGGHGKIMQSLPPNCHIDYLEYSSAMIKKATKNADGRNVNFIHGDFLEVTLTQQYDWVLTNFFLDVFSSANLQLACQKIHRLVKADGKVMVTDFSEVNHLQGRLLLWVMHTFFKLVAGLESSTIQPIRQQLQASGFEVSEEKIFSGGKVFSVIFKKVETFQ